MDAMTFEKPEVQRLVSVVIPTYRGERFIGEALKSIAAQTYRNWEVIVVEDGSTGPTESIVRRFARKHLWHRVTYRRSEQNLGPSATRNTAFRLARGEPQRWWWVGPAAAIFVVKTGYETLTGHSFFGTQALLGPIKLATTAHAAGVITGVLFTLLLLTRPADEPPSPAA